MDKIERIKILLKDIGMPVRQQADICALTILAMANLKKTTKWSEASNEWNRIHDIITFVNKNYGVSYAENSRETFRKQALHYFRSAAIVEDNSKVTNSPDYRYRLTDEFVEILRNCNKSSEPLNDFKMNHHSLIEIYASKRNLEKMPVKINGEDFSFSKGKHNQLQKAVCQRSVLDCPSILKRFVLLRRFFNSMYSSNLLSFSNDLDSVHGIKLVGLMIDMTRFS